MIFLSKWVIYRFHVNLPGCNWDDPPRNGLIVGLGWKMDPCMKRYFRKKHGEYYYGQWWFIRDDDMIWHAAENCTFFLVNGVFTLRNSIGIALVEPFKWLVCVLWNVLVAGFVFSKFSACLLDEYKGAGMFIDCEREITLMIWVIWKD